MKKLVVFTGIALSGLLYNKANAQIGFSANVNFRPAITAYNQQANVPDVVYTTNGQPITIDGDDYYYLPDIGAYYDVTDQLYIYFNGENWIASAYLPGAYANFDWTTSRRFEIRAYRPFFNDGFYRERYAGVRIMDWNHRDWDDFARRDDRGFNQPVVNRGYERPLQQYRPEGGQFEKRPEVTPDFRDNSRGFSQPVQNRTFNRPAQPYRPVGGQFENKAQSKPGFQTNNRGLDNRGGSENFGQKSQDKNFNGKRMTKF